MANDSVIGALLARRLEGKVALITGGASGIGECTAKLFAKHGAKVVIADIQDELGHAVCKDIGETSASYVPCDVTDETQVQNAVDITVASHGKLDIIFNNAGILFVLVCFVSHNFSWGYDVLNDALRFNLLPTYLFKNRYAGIADEFKPRIVDNEKKDFERVLAVNVTGVFLCTKHAARVMIPARTGSIISTASISSYVGGAASHAYSCSKHAVLGLTRNAAVELGQFGIRVNCLAPYALATPLAMGFTKMGDEELEQAMCAIANLKGVTLKAEDVAQAALYLASDDSKYVSGQNLFIDGAFSIVNPSFNLFEYPEP
ncbi:hypothetical protein GIB67_012717 [Kingdonia uniflora]|uniref:Secoisolariciresinol dehydrogenase n=1 Tax=Kingdonia uniflora TaxID=39325 RepID=A0A7J7NFP3_9MAGN|nr:hypothetical protein GIB67_012717 [Kingdonia uniflora]